MGRLPKRVRLIAGREVMGRAHASRRQGRWVHALDRIGRDGKSLVASPPPTDRNAITPQKRAPSLAASVGGRNR